MNNNVQKRGTLFPIFFPDSKDPETIWDRLMDTGATRNCMNYSTFMKLGNGNLRQKGTPTVTVADDSNLGAKGITTCKIQLETEMIKQDFIVCTYLKQNLILGIDFAHLNYAGIEWKKEGTRILTLKGKNMIEVTEDELGIPVTTHRNVTIPPRTGGVFHVDVNPAFDTNLILTPYTLYFQHMPMVYPHEIVIPPIQEENDKIMHVKHITNVGKDKSWYIKKGDVVAFAQPESDAVQYMNVLGPEHEIKQNLQVRPRNWIPKSANIALIEVSKTFTHMENTINGEDSLLTLIDLHTSRKKIEENSENSLKSCKTDVEEEEVTGPVADVRTESMSNQCEIEENSHESQRRKKETNDKWENIQEVVGSDFLTSPAGIYRNRRMELEDAEICEKTRVYFAQLCDEYDDVFSKNNQDIGKTTLIEMEIDTRDSLPAAQSPYTLPLKEYEWVRKQIEMLQKAGVIVKSLSPWASPVIVVPKKSTPDEPPHRRLVIDYRKINSLQQQIKRADKTTGCLSLYPLLKIDEMFANLGRSFRSSIDEGLRYG